jgi:hypothetical protein
VEFANEAGGVELDQQPAQLVDLGLAQFQKVVGYPPLSEMGDQQRREFHEALLGADTFEDLPGKWQAAILKAEQNRPKLRVVSAEELRKPKR